MDKCKEHARIGSCQFPSQHPFKEAGSLKIGSLGTSCSTDRLWLGRGGVRHTLLSSQHCQALAGRGSETVPAGKGRKKGVFSVLDLRIKTKRRFREGAGDLAVCAGGGKGSPLTSEQLKTRPRKTAHSCGLRFKTERNELRQSFSPAWVSDAPLQLRDQGAALPRVSLSFSFERAPLSQAAMSASKFAFARRPLPATCTRLPGTPRAGWSAGTRGFAGFLIWGCWEKTPTKSLSSSSPPSPGPAPPSLHAHAAPPGHTRCEVLLPPDNGLWAGQAARPGPPAPVRDPERAERGSWRETETSEAGEATKGKVGASPLGQEARSRHGEKRRGRGSAAPPRPEPRGPAAHSPARWQIAPPVHLARASAASKARCAP